MRHTITKHKRLFALLKQRGLYEQRSHLVSEFTNGRSDSSKDLTEREIDKLIALLEAEEKQTNSDFWRGDHMRKKIFSLCFDYGWTIWSDKKQRMVVDQRRLNSWMLKYSILHKALNEYKYDELPALVTQFESVVSSFYEAESKG